MIYHYRLFKIRYTHHQLSSPRNEKYSLCEVFSSIYITFFHESTNKVNNRKIEKDIIYFEMFRNIEEFQQLLKSKFELVIFIYSRVKLKNM